jgi:hypothetical protein
MSRANQRQNFAWTVPVVVLVEGIHPTQVVELLTERLGIADRLDVVDFGGQGDLRKAMRRLVDAVGFKEHARVVAVLRDAEEHPAEANRRSTLDLWAGIQSESSSRRRVMQNVALRSYIFPDDSRGGMFEDLCLETFAGSVAEPCVAQLLDCLQAASPESALAARHPKGRLQLFLALSRTGQGVSLGTAARERAINLDHPAFEPLKGLLRELIRGFAASAV